MIVSSPLYVPVSKNKKFILNLNNYRNSHYQTLNKSKISYKSIIAEQVLRLPKMEKIAIHYTLYPKTKRLTDLDNVISIHAKFFQDALAEFGRIPNDNYLYIPYSTQSFGMVDKDNPRVEINIDTIKT